MKYHQCCKNVQCGTPPPHSDIPDCNWSAVPASEKAN